MIPLEQSLNGGYKGLYGEVVTEDTYRLRSLTFIPDVVFDFGGNVGIFARYAQSLWPSATIISVEPHPENIAVYKHYTKGTILIEKAIGVGELWHPKGAPNGAHESYLSTGLGYEGMDKADNIEAANVPTIMPDEIINEYMKPGMKSVLKLDIEGAENCLWSHSASIQAMQRIDYLCFELHYFALTGKLKDEVVKQTMEAMHIFAQTHDIEMDHIYVWALKKNEQ